MRFVSQFRVVDPPKRGSGRELGASVLQVPHGLRQLVIVLSFGIIMQNGIAGEQH